MAFEKKTHEQFVAEVFELVGNEYEVLEKYINCSTKLTFKHKKCGKQYKVSPNKFLVGRRCIYCQTSRKHTTEDFELFLKEKLNDEYKLLSEYKNSHTKVKIKHKKCSFVYMVAPTNIKGGSGCPNCYGNVKKTTEVFEKEVREMYGDEYKVVSEYISGVKPILMYHSFCEETFKTTPGSFLKGVKCGKCRYWDTQKYKNHMKELVGNEYELISEYINSKTKIKILHKICGYEYKVTPHSFLRGNGCPNCKESKGEKEIRKWLQKNHVYYKREYKFSNCLSEKGFKLRFDFAVFTNNSLIAVIEFDGTQHYEPVEWMGGLKNFKETQDRDSIKNKYCHKNKIPLIRIPYWEHENIETILNENILPLLNKQIGFAF